MPLKVIELFSGVGTFSMALRDLGIKYKLVDSVEIDPYAVKAFNAIHGTDYQAKDITEWGSFNDGAWDKNTRIDLVTGGFPCQDISIAGKQAGIVRNETRSGLMYEMLRVVGEIRPTWVIAENVKNILSKKHKPQLNEYIREMDKMGYATDYKVLDAKDFGVPQHRERIFIISYKRPELGRSFAVKWPESTPLKKKLKDVLEKTVDEKYYLSKDKVKNIRLRDKGNVVGLLDIKGQECIRRVYSQNGVAPTLSTMQGGQRQPKIIDPQGRKDKVCVPRDFAPTLRAQAHGNDPVIIDDTYGFDGEPRQYSGVSPTLRAGRQGLKVDNQIRVRRLTPRECWRLMGYSDVDFNKAKKAGLSDTRLYKLAGNGIVLNVAKAILRGLFCAKAA